MRRIVGIGEIVLDIVFRGNQPKAAVPGGSTFNAMISLGRTAARKLDGLDLQMVSQMGNDMVSEMIGDFMSRNSLGSEYVSRIDGTQSTVSIAVLDKNNDARYEFLRDKTAPKFDPEEIEFHKGDILLFGSFFAIGEATWEQTQRIVRKAKDAGAIIYYDINFRKNHYSTLPVTKKHIETNISLSDIVRGSSEDIEVVFGSSDAAKVYRENISPLCRTFICTKGAEPTEVFCPASEAAFDVQKIQTVSTIGAGDNFNAGFIYALVKNSIEKEQVPSLSQQDWSKLVPTALEFSANVCQSLENYVDEDFADTL